MSAPIFTDQMGNKIVLKHTPPKRIISLVPSQTELLYDLGLREEVIGITKFCVHPQEWFESKSKIKVGGTKNFHIDRIEALQPDLIIGNKEENVKEGIEALQQKFPVWMSDIHTFKDALQMIEQVSILVGKEKEGKKLLKGIKRGFEDLQNIFSPKKAVSVLYLIWRKPYMAAGSDTFIDEMLKVCNFDNGAKHLSRYPVLTQEDLQNLSPKLLLLSSEPYPFREKHISELQFLLPHTKIVLVDGEFFSWYGSRMLKAASYFKKLIGSL
ncbi:MAG: helical backbone metal receptor [Chitinophagales bacterium]